MIEEEHKQQINEERLSRMLANELFETEETWINYNDEIAELLVEISRLIEEKMYFESELPDDMILALDKWRSYFINKSEK